MKKETKASVAIVIGTVGTFLGVIALASYRHDSADCRPSQTNPNQCSTGHGGGGSGGGGRGSNGSTSAEAGRGGFGGTGEGHAGGGGSGGE